MSRRARRIALAGLGVLLLGVVLVQCGVVPRLFMQPMEPPESQAGASLDDLPEGAVRTMVEELEVPWEIAFLPDGGLLVTERPGRILRFPSVEAGAEGPLTAEDGDAWEVDGVEATGEGGLMGVALHPEFRENGWVYVMMTAQAANGLENRIERFRLEEDGLADRTRILDGIPGGRFHNGGRIAFGPDGFLYVTTGDAGDRDLAQEPASLAGKILRVTEDGEVPTDNPTEAAWWSYGHRNPQGLAWDAEGRLWSTEHGRSGLRTGLDELNRIEPGGNYGWPVIEGDEEREGMIGPVVHSGPDYVWAPGGVARLGERLYFGGLRGEALYDVALDGEQVAEIRAHFARELGRIRAVVAGPEGALWLATSNRDGRGSARPGDDRIVRLDPDALPR